MIATAVNKMFNLSKLQTFIDDICTATCKKLINEAQANFEVQIMQNVEKLLNHAKSSTDKQMPKIVLQNSLKPTILPTNIKLLKQDITKDGEE